MNYTTKVGTIIPISKSCSKIYSQAPLNYLYSREKKNFICGMNKEAETTGAKVIARVLAHIGIKSPTLANNVGVEYKRVQNVETGKTKKVSGDLASKIVARYPEFSLDWLLTGEGEMLKDGAPATQPAQENSARPLVSSDRDWVEIPLVPHRAKAGALSGFGDPCWEEDKQTMPVLIDKRLKGDYLLFEVSGDSMDDGTSTAFLDGDVLLCRVLPKSDWQFGIKKRGETYCVVATDAEGIVLKEVVNHDKANNEITCHLLNSQYKDYSVKLDDVQGIFYVEELVKRKF